VTTTEELLGESTRCLLAVRGAHGALLSRAPSWYDGAGLWTTTSASTVKAALPRRDSVCAAYLPPLEGEEEGAVVRGSARVFGLHDPLGTVLHWPTISAAMIALAARNAGAVLEYVQHAARAPARVVPGNSVVIRIPAEEVRRVTWPHPVPGVAPALPPVIPAEVRRAVGGRRRVVLAAADTDLLVTPAVWGAGFALQLPGDVVLAEGAPAQVVVEEERGGRPAIGLAVRGVVDGRGALTPERYTWWQGFDSVTVDAPVDVSGIQLPD
jgi:hypothetical protein